MKDEDNANEDERVPLLTPTPVVGAPVEFPWLKAIHALTSGAIMIFFSVSLIYFNSYLMQHHRFPHSMFLVCLHMAFCTVFGCALFLIKPGLFPALSDPDLKVNVDGRFIGTVALPISVFFVGGLVFGNMAYAHSSVCFLQMLKESNLVFVYLISIWMGVETFQIKQVKVILLAIIALSLSIHGEMHFTLVGFLLQITAVLCEAMRINLQTLVLSGKGKLDPLSYVLILSPVSLVLLLTAFSAIHVGDYFVSSVTARDVPALTIPSFAAIEEYAPLLLGSCSLAFCLNVSIAVVITTISSMGYVFAQVCKDVAAVCVGICVMKETVSGLQRFGFFCQIMAVYLWGMTKQFPEKMDNGLVAGMWEIHFERFMKRHRPNKGILDPEKPSEAMISNTKCA